MGIWKLENIRLLIGGNKYYNHVPIYIFNTYLYMIMYYTRIYYINKIP